MNQTMNITIRAAHPSDLPLLKTFERGIVTAERPYDETLKPDPISYYDIQSMMESDEAEVAVAEVNGNCVASGYVRKKRSLDYVTHEYHAFIGFLYVEPAHRGMGLNKLILEHLFDWARSNDLLDVHLTVYPENASAVRAYEKAGFRPHILEMSLQLDKKAK